jgi:hypothetical protein
VALVTGREIGFALAGCSALAVVWTHPLCRYLGTAQTGRSDQHFWSINELVLWER